MILIQNGHNTDIKKNIKGTFNKILKKNLFNICVILIDIFSILQKLYVSLKLNYRYHQLID